VSHLLELVDEADRNKDGKIDFDEFDFMGMSAGFFGKRCFDG
jgi:EF hand